MTTPALDFARKKAQEAPLEELPAWTQIIQHLENELVVTAKYLRLLEATKMILGILDGLFSPP